ncbi:hypothetical protein MauCBS54593_006603 [Microsporum audouinii]
MGLEREIINDGSAREISQNRKFIKEPGSTFTSARWVNNGVVITVKINRNTPEITLSRWEREFPVQWPNLRNTRPSGRVVEEIVATRESGVTKVTGDLTIPFEKLAARAANGPQECDTIVTKDQVSTICELAWAAQEFM